MLTHVCNTYNNISITHMQLAKLGILVTVLFIITKFETGYSMYMKKP